MRSDDMRALGRLGRPVHETSRRSRSRRLAVRRAGTATVATRRPVVPRPIIAGLVAGVLVLVYLGVVAGRQTADLPSTSTALAAAPTGEQATASQAEASSRRALPAADRSRRAATLEEFGAVDGLRLTLPHAAPLAVAFHEANRPEALPIDPVGELEANDNATRYVAPADQPGPAYRILSSRGRGRPATSAVDIVLPDGARSHAPVSGIVTEVKRYTLSGTLQDWRVVIQPDTRKDLHVVMIHLHEPQVSVGDRVTAGSSPIAVARLLPFASHVDYVVGERHPHVHLEVKPASTEPRLDPNAPAVEASEAQDVARRD